MSEQPEETPAAEQLPPLPRPSRWPAVLAVFSMLTVVALVGVGHFYWQSMQGRFAHLRQVMEQSQNQQQTLINQVEETSRAFDEQRERIVAQQKLIHSQIKTIEAQSAKLAEDRQLLADQGEAVRQSLQNLHDQGGRTGQEWRAAEAAYLIELAQNRLRLEKDPDTAAEALQAARKRLEETGDPLWDPVRKALDEDLKALNDLPVIDREALAKDLLRLAMGVRDLPLLPVRYKSDTQLSESNDDNDNDNKRDLDSLVQDGWQAIKSLVRIHHDEWTDSTPKGPEQRDSLRNSLRLQLDAARFGLLSKDVKLYQGSLETAQTWLGSFFKPDAAETQLYQEEIQRLQGTRILPELPDLKPTLQTLHALLDSRQPKEQEETAE